MFPAFAQFSGLIGGSMYIYAKDVEVTLDHQISWKVDGAATAIASLVPFSNPTYSGRCNAGKCELFFNGTLRMDQLTSSDNRTYRLTAMLANLEVTEHVLLYVYSK